MRSAMLSLDTLTFSLHMLMHMIVVAVLAPLLALAIAGREADPVRKYPALFPPIPISLIELVVVWVWHAPALHHAARTNTGWLILEQTMFLFSGVLVWLSAFGGDRARRFDRAGAGIAALLLTSMHMTVLGALLALSARPLYLHTHDELTAIEDQHLGGAIMLIAGGAAYLLGGLWLTVELLRAKK